MDIPEGIGKWPSRGQHILVTSRQYIDIERPMRSFLGYHSIIHLQSTFVDTNIPKYAHHRLSDDKHLKKWPPDLRDKIETAVTEGANGMYAFTRFLSRPHGIPTVQ